MKSQEIEEKDTSVKRQWTSERRDSFSKEKTEEMFALLSLPADEEMDEKKGFQEIFSRLVEEEG